MSASRALNLELLTGLLISSLIVCNKDNLFFWIATEILRWVLCGSAGVPSENVLYLGGPNIASEVYNKEYANARICGSERWRKPLAKFLRQPYCIVWDNPDIVTHEVMGGLKNVYAIGAGELLASWMFLD
jgi:glycerol-3-phosphate dehydrogenase